MLSNEAIQGRLDEVKAQLAKVNEAKEKIRVELQEHERQTLILQGAIAGLESLSDLEADTSEQQEPEEIEE